MTCILFAFSCSKEDDDTGSTKPKQDPDCFATTSYTDQLPNMDFENWGYPDSSDNKYRDPCGGIFASSNAVSAQFDLITSQRSADAQNGDYAANIVTGSFFGGVLLAPGILFVGEFTSYQLDLQKLLSNARFGVPFTERPASFQGFHKYTSVNGDSAYIAVMLSRYDQQNKIKDTVGFGELTIRNTITQYTEFDIPIDYNYAAGTEQPDSVAIVFISSKEIEDLLGEDGSSLWVDNCKFTY